MRDFSTVIERILPLIPDEHGALRDELGSLSVRSLYQPPEAQGAVWRAASRALQGHLGKEVPTEGWKLRVHNIFADIEKIPETKP